MSEVQLPTLLAEGLRKAGKGLYTAGDKMPEDRIAWKPETEGNAGRDALDQILECAYLNAWGAEQFRTRESGPLNESDFEAQCRANANKTAALRWLKDGTNALADAVEAMTPAQLGGTLVHPFYKNECTWAEYAGFFLWNTIYHEGQVNYIQVLYGDKS